MCMCVGLCVYEPVSAWCPQSSEDKSLFLLLELEVAVSCPPRALETGLDQYMLIAAEPSL